jgi:DNA repair photolyase
MKSPVEIPNIILPNDPVNYWSHAAIITKNNFQFKSLSGWAFNIAIGCAHGCTFCYVPEVSVMKLAKNRATAKCMSI